MQVPANRILTNARKFTIDEIQGYPERYLPCKVALTSFINVKTWTALSAHLNIIQPRGEALKAMGEGAGVGLDPGLRQAPPSFPPQWVMPRAAAAGE